MKLKYFTNYYTVFCGKFIIFTISILLIACTKTILLESVPIESAGNPFRGEGANVTKSTVLDISSTDPIYSNENESEEDSLEVYNHADTKIKKENNKDSSNSTSVLYACPMHSEVTSNNPKDICPKCNMLINKVVKSDQTKLKKSEKHSSHQSMNHGAVK